jgi:NAD(P)-dependent dehydrogenase (short-subunit alcohol dehydrogenase family)
VVLEIEAIGGRCSAIPVDVSEPLAIEYATELVESRSGLIDVWVNVAFTLVFAPERLIVLCASLAGIFTNAMVAAGEEDVASEETT